MRIRKMAACRKRKGNPDRKRNDEKKQISGKKKRREETYGKRVLRYQ